MKNKLSSYLRQPWTIVGFIVLINIIIRGIIILRNYSTQTNLSEVEQLLYVGSYAQALTDIDSLIKLDPENTKLLAKKCTILSKIGDIPGTVKCFEGLTKISSTSTYLKLYKAILLISHNDYAGAQIYINSIITNGSSTDELINLRAGISAYGVNDISGATHYLDSAIATDVNDPYALYYRGLIAQSNQDQNGSLKYFDRAEKNGIVDPTFLYTKGLTLIKIGYREDAILDFDKIIKTESDNAGAFFQRGYALFQLEEYQDALDNYNRSLILKPNDAKTLYEKGNTLFKLGNYEGAINFYNKSINVLSGEKNTSPYMSKLLAYYVLGDVYNVNKLKSEIDSMISTYARENAMMGKIYSQMKNFNQAFVYIDYALNLYPGYKPAYYEEVNILIRQAIDLDRFDKYKDANLSLDKAAYLDNGAYTGNNNIKFFKGLTALLEGSRSVAEGYFQQVWGGYQSGDMETVLILRNIREGKFDIAQQMIDQMSNDFPRNPNPGNLKIFLVNKMNEAGKSKSLQDAYVIQDTNGVQQAMKTGLKKYNDYFSRYREL